MIREFPIHLSPYILNFIFFFWTPEQCRAVESCGQRGSLKSSMTIFDLHSFL